MSLPGWGDIKHACSSVAEGWRGLRALGTQADNLQLRKQLEAAQASIAELEAARDLRARVKHDRNAVWLDGAAGDDYGPYCAVCWGKDQKLVHLTITYSDRRHGVCNACTKGFPLEMKDREPPASPRRGGGWPRNY